MNMASVRMFEVVSGKCNGIDIYTNGNYVRNLSLNLVPNYCVYKSLAQCARVR